MPTDPASQAEAQTAADAAAGTARGMSARARWTLWVSGILGASLMTFVALRIDAGVSQWFEDARRPMLTRMALIVTSGWTVVVIMALGSAYLALRGRKREAAVTVAATLFALGVGYLVKETIGRPRPYATLTDFVSLTTASDASFPSNHTASSFTLALVLGLYIPRLRWPLLFLAAGIASTRLYIGVHYLSDVCGGLALAFVSASWCVEVFAPPDREPRIVEPPDPDDDAPFQATPA